MARQSSFRHYNLDQATRYTLNITSFLGVDYSTQKFLISDGHAVDMKNFVYRGGVVQKRHGVEILFQAKPFRYIRLGWDGESGDEVRVNCGGTESDPPRFNGMWRFTAEDGKSHIIAHIGKLLYEIKDLGKDWMDIEPFRFGTAMTKGETAPLCYEFEDYKSSAYVGGRKLWFQGGCKFMVIRFLADGSFWLRPCADDLYVTPIPTTCVSITYKDSQASNRMALDSVNLLTKWRKNKLISGTGKNESAKSKTADYEYVLDAPLIWKSEDEDMMNFSMRIEECGKMED